MVVQRDQMKEKDFASNAVRVKVQQREIVAFLDQHAALERCPPPSTKQPHFAVTA
jgi:hypothetical protein